MLTKYKDLYILKDDEMKQIENGTIEITNLNPSKIYSFPIYAKINEEYCYLFTKYTDKTQTINKCILTNNTLRK